MHELGIAQSIFDVVQTYVPPPRAARLRDVRIRVGDVAGVVTESLEFCFEAIVAGTPWASARLVIDRVGGRDLQLVDLEVDDAEERAS